MKIPGFTAEESLYKTNGHYLIRSGATLTGQVVPQYYPFIPCRNACSCCKVSGKEWCCDLCDECGPQWMP